MTLNKAHHINQTSVNLTFNKFCDGKIILFILQVYAARQPYNENTVSGSIRVIDKDVPRTDRELPQFK